MDAVPCSWSTKAVQESFSHSRAGSDTLSRLAKLMSRAEQKQAGRSRRHRSSDSSSTCPECSLIFLNATELLRHQKAKHMLPKPHQCHSCGKGFSLLSSLQLHECAIDGSSCELCQGEPDLSAPCPACMSGASDPDSPQDKSPAHQPHLHDSSPYACAPCGRGFSQKQALLYHQQAGCSEPPSPLSVDDPGAFPHNSSPAVSEAGSTPSDSSDTPGLRKGAVKCLFCPRSLRSGAGLHSHTRIAHPKEMLMAKNAQSQKKRGAVVGRGRKRVGNKVNCSPVIKRKSRQKLLNCRSCDMVFKSTAKLYLHRREKHSRERELNREPKRTIITKRRKGETYPCPVCSKVFLHHLSLLAHSRQHAASAVSALHKRYWTQTSENTGNTKASKLAGKKSRKLKHNMADNDTVKMGLKASTGKKWTRSEQLDYLGRDWKVPKVEEDVDGDFPCPSCPQVFSLQSQLREHVEMHQSSIRRTSCSVCAQDMDICKGPGSRQQRLYHCMPCKQAFSALDPFLKHCQEHLRIKVEEDGDTEYHCYNGNRG